MGSGEHSAFRDLPALYRRLLPELETLPVIEERRADCMSCPMVAAGTFAAESRCCTYHPAMANFLVGRALERGGAGAARVRERLRDLDGVSAWGIYPRRDEHRRYVATREVAFGNDSSMRCPYWVGGAESCGVWLDRPSACRTWFCKHEGGAPGALLWQAVEAAIWQVENRLAFHLGKDPRAPVSADADAGAFEAWFRACAARLDAIDPGELAHQTITAARTELRARAVRATRPMPEVLVPSVGEVRDHPTDRPRLLVIGYSSFDPAVAPPGLYEALARMDGATSWRAAIAGTALTEADVRELFRAGALAAPSL
ncbi:MAG TPA: hypothetical protein VML75_23700 [Kofleriaceae bacterium]|nr:hypothetical protein [Kofleriaceae bacterium]